jgi:hypothetical protein
MTDKRKSESEDLDIEQNRFMLQTKAKLTQMVREQ